jgi:predicted amidohydrolase
MRVAVTQFATTSDVQQNLATCLRIINQAVLCKPAIIVLPEFCNAAATVEDHNHAWNCALTTKARFFLDIANLAKKHGCYIVINVTLRREPSREHQDGTVKSAISVTSCLFSPSGELVLQADKQNLMGHENNFFMRGTQVSDVSTTPFGNVGLFSGSDGMTFETPRCLALRGAQLLCSSLHCFGLDQSSLHVNTRAAENKVFVAAANTIGPLHSQQPLQPLQPQQLMGAGDSQIVSPDGTVLAKVAHGEEGFVFADINLDDSQNKRRPDGSDIFNQRRPELYQALTQVSKDVASDGVSANINAAIFATYKTNEQAIEDVCHYIENNLSDIIQLPELFFIADTNITDEGDKLTQALAQLTCLSNKVIKQVSAQLRPFQYVCTSLVLDGVHQAVLINKEGIFARQQQLHFCQRHQWTTLGDELHIIELPLEQGSITLAMLTADDANVPEIVKVAAFSGIHLLLVPFAIQQAEEVNYNLLSRAAENRICVLAACREKSFAAEPVVNKPGQKRIKANKLAGLIANLPSEFTLFSPWQSQPFDGNINPPIVKLQGGKITKALIHPLTACNKVMADKTNLLKDRSWVISAE